MNQQPAYIAQLQHGQALTIKEHEERIAALECKLVEIERQALNVNAIDTSATCVDKNKKRERKPWVGLTEDDLRQIILAAVGVAEAKLKVKNT